VYRQKHSAPSCLFNLKFIVLNKQLINVREFADHCRLEETSNIYTRQAATGFFRLCWRKQKILENLQASKETETGIENCHSLTGTGSRDFLLQVFSQIIFPGLLVILVADFRFFSKISVTICKSGYEKMFKKHMVCS
jgi:hypothetical protein